jgi:hypothetical protein
MFAGALETGFFSFRFQAEEVSDQIIQLVVGEHILKTGHVQWRRRSIRIEFRLDGNANLDLGDQFGLSVAVGRVVQWGTACPDWALKLCTPPLPPTPWQAAQLNST